MNSFKLSLSYEIWGCHSSIDTDILLGPEDGSSILLRNVSIYPPIDTA
jgi:hypothetical protein